MPLRKVPGALALGLIASLAAHAALFGGEHAVGGSYQSPLLQIALASTLGLLGGLFALALGGRAEASDGTVLAARLSGFIPSRGWVALSSLLWYAGIERLEPHHAAVLPIFAVVALAVAAIVVRALAGAALRLLCAIVFRVLHAPFAQRELTATRRHCARLFVRRSPALRRRFARPPPTAFALARA